MRKFASLLVSTAVCVGTACAAAASIAPGDARPETLVIRGSHEATVTIPVGAVSAFSADNAVALPSYANGEVEAMRLSGDVRIRVMGTAAPIQIRADQLVLELTADAAPARMDEAGPGARKRNRVQSARVIVDDEQTQTFLGDVVFTVQTAAGALRIKADRLERLTGAAG
ncbi:MAG TPA: hypothetical protein VME42_01105 [Steroidobacteraceae bacterium]|nr:hypothetical protein [Steroidobacteraceae bacterium]